MKTYLNAAVSLLLIASVVLLSSCGGDDPKPKTKTEIISAQPWKLTRIKVTVGSTSQEGDPEACTADDVHTFEADGDYRFDEGATKCDPDDPQSSNGKWEFNTDETVIRITQGGLTFNQTILEFSETKMRVRLDFISPEVVEYTFEPK